LRLSMSLNYSLVLFPPDFSFFLCIGYQSVVVSIVSAACVA
jgi:hypothetical protein